MATLNKNFKIKSGLIVEGTTATVNGHQVLTENASDQYILDLIGGETLVKSVDSHLSVDGSGKLSINRSIVDTWYDEAGAASSAQSAAESYADGLISTEVTNRNNAIATAKSEAISASETYTDNAISAEVTNRNSAISSAISTEVTNRNSAIATAKSEAISTSEGYTDDAISQEVSDRNSAISTAITNLNLSGTYDALGAASQALADANTYTDNAVTDLVNSAPAMLDTLGELATALQNNPDIITNLQDVAAGKQDTLTTGNGIVIDNNLIYVPTYIGSGISATPSTVEIDRDTVDTWYDAAGAASSAQSAAASDATTKANAAEQNAKNYADGLAVNYDAAGSASSAQTAAQNYADGLDSATNTRINNLDTDDVAEGSNLYFTDFRAKTSAADLLTGATLSNITITGSGQGLTITAENGVAQSTTDDLTEGSTNKYFTDQRVLDAVNNSTITPTAVEINNYRKEEATQQYVGSASTVNVHTFAYPYESVKYLVRVVGWDGGVKHSQITEILMTVDGNNNIAMTEYGNVHTSTNPLATFSADVVNGNPTLTATTAVNGCEVIAAATMLSWAD